MDQISSKKYRQLRAGEVWSGEFVTITEYVQRPLIGVGTGLWPVRTLYYKHNDNKLSIHHDLKEDWAVDETTNIRTSRLIKYYSDKAIPVFVKIKARWPNKLIYAYNNDHVLDTITLHRLLMVYDYDVNKIPEESFELFVFNRYELQKCMPCTSLLSTCTGAVGGHTITDYDLGPSHSFIIPIPTKVKTTTGIKRCIWHRDHDGYINDLIPDITDYDYCYHSHQQYGHTHMHWYSKHVNFTVTSTNEELTPFDVSIADSLLNTITGILKHEAKTNKLTWKCSNISHEIPLPVDNAFKQCSDKGKVYLLMLMALIHSGILMKSWLGQARRFFNSNLELKSHIWKCISQSKRVFMDTAYSRWILAYIRNNQIPVCSTSEQAMAITAVKPDLTYDVVFVTTDSVTYCKKINSDKRSIKVSVKDYEPAIFIKLMFTDLFYQCLIDKERVGIIVDQDIINLLPGQIYTISDAMARLWQFNIKYKFKGLKAILQKDVETHYPELDVVDFGSDSDVFKPMCFYYIERYIGSTG